MLVGSIPAILSSLETHFKFSSIQLGMFALIVAGLLSVIFVSYFGECGHKPRWLGASLVIQEIACLLFTLPQWIFEMYTPGYTRHLWELCLAEGSDGNETNVDFSLEDYTALALSLFANFVLVIGITPLYTTGVTFIDDTVHPKYVPFFLAVHNICPYHWYHCWLHHNRYVFVHLCASWSRDTAHPSLGMRLRSPWLTLPGLGHGGYPSLSAEFCSCCCPFYSSCFHINFPAAQPLRKKWRKRWPKFSKMISLVVWISSEWLKYSPASSSS